MRKLQSNFRGKKREAHEKVTYISKINNTMFVFARKIPYKTLHFLKNGVYFHTCNNNTSP